MPPIETYNHCWPLFISVFPPVFDIAELNRYISEVNDLYKKQQRFVSLVDTSQVLNVPSASQRKHLADWQNATVEQIRRLNVCTTLVIRSAAMRGGITALNWLFRPPTEQIIVGTFEEAFARSVEKLLADGQKIPEEIARMARSSPPRSAEDTLPARRMSRA